MGFIKDTALVSQVGVFELTFRGQGARTTEGFSGILVFGTIALLYFAMSYPLSRWGRWLEQRLASSRSQRPQQRLRPAARSLEASISPLSKGEVVALIGPVRLGQVDASCACSWV